MKILVTDDSKSVHGFIEAMFEGSEHTLEHAYDGAELVEKIKAGAHVDVILLDWEMPILAGVDALKQLRKDGNQTPIIMDTSRNNINNISEALSEGANEYIMKPFTKDILFEKLEMVMERKVA